MSKILELPTIDEKTVTHEVQVTLDLLNEAARIIAYIDEQLNIRTAPETAEASPEEPAGKDSPAPGPDSAVEVQSEAM